MTAPPREGQTFAGESFLVRYANFVKLPHTVFALPFALLGVVYASFEHRVTLGQILLVILAFTAARYAAMGFNRIVDRHFDHQNPRTSGRELPTGTLSLKQAAWSVALASLVFFAAAWSLNPLCFALSPLALGWILGYSYSKRFTSWSHIWLGGALAAAPVGGYLAVVGQWSDPWWTLPAAAAAVLTWVAGFDILYALQDERFDRQHGLKSAVVLLGRQGSIITSKLFHAIALAMLVLFGFGTSFGALYYVGVLLAAGILAWEHQLVDPADLSRLDAAFFRMNGIMSLVVFVCAVGDRIL
jgi:4-hydroxybenzoate polyprenyltransferase